MERSTYLDVMQRRLEAYFDIQQPYEYHNMEMDLYAKSDMRNERYFASKKIKVYAIENKEHVFIKYTDDLTGRVLEDFWQKLLKAAEELPEPHSEHMSTIISGVLMTHQNIGRDIQEKAEKLKFEKSFLFGLKGWVYVRLVVVDLQSETMVHNKRGKEVEELYSPGKPVKR